MVIGSLWPITKYMLFDNSNYCFLNHNHELITLKFVILACMRICHPIVRFGCHILVLRVNLPGFTLKSTWFKLTYPNLAGLISSDGTQCFGTHSSLHHLGQPLYFKKLICTCFCGQYNQH